MQTKRQSAIEVITGTTVGLIVSWVIGQYWIYPEFGWHPSMTQNFLMTSSFTVVSIIRSYLWRRLFNWFVACKEAEDKEALAHVHLAWDELLASNERAAKMLNADVTLDHAKHLEDARAR